MPINSYDNPSSLAPQIGFQPNGFLGGMWSGQRNQNYQQAVEQSNLMKALAAKEQMNKMQEYQQNTPVRDAQRLSQIAGFNANAANIGAIQGGQGAMGRAQQQTAKPEANSKIKQWLAEQDETAQKKTMRILSNMEAVGETLFNSPGHDTLEGQAQRNQLLNRYRQQFPELELPNEWNPQTEGQIFQRYQMAKTFGDMRRKDALANTQLQGQNQRNLAGINNAASLDRTEVQAEATKYAAQSRSDILKTYQSKIIQLETKKNLSKQLGSSVSFTAEDAAQLARHRKELLTEKALSAVGQAIPTLIMQGKPITEEAMGNVVRGIVKGLSEDTPVDPSAAEKWAAEWAKVPPGGSKEGLDGKTYTKKAK